MKDRQDLYTTEDRKAWIELLASATLNDLDRMNKQLPADINYGYIVKPETGMIMVQACADGAGERFNFGEVTVTKCVLQVQERHLGYAMVMGSNHDRARLAALFDGLLQNPEYHPAIKGELLERLALKQQQEKQALAQQIDETRVEFFTLKRGE